MIYPCIGMSFSGIAFLMEDVAFVQTGVPWCSVDVAYRSFMNLKCEVADVNIGIHVDFRVEKCVFVEYN